MSLEGRLKNLERAAAADEQPQPFIVVDTVLGKLQIPIHALPSLEKIYGPAPEMKAIES
jgi:hypothetical protein